MESATKNKQTADDILQMVRQAFGDSLSPETITIRELTEGLFNAAYEVTFPDKPVILKIAPPADVQVMSYEKNMMKAEVEALKLVKENTAVPVPQVLYYDDSHTICKVDYFFMDKIEGDNFFTLKNNGLIPQETQLDIYREAGYYNREMNRIQGTAFGYMALPEKQGDNWKDVFLIMMEDVLKDGEDIGISLGTEYDEVRALIQKASGALEEVKQPYFVHWDLWEGNIFVKDGKISGIIDLERALWADPLMEYNFRGHTDVKEFYEGYGTNLKEAGTVRALLYDMYLYLIMVIETKYRMYSNDWQYGFSTERLAMTMKHLNSLV